MSKQTASQWLKDVLYPYLNKEDKEYTDVLFNHALQMEREQMIDFCQMWEDSPLEKYDCKEDLFNETYGCKNENTITTNKR